ncbi:hypothetical protein QI085_10985, partial [Staphylococcus saprophyticus]|nr:hypothetical protein [Staphylococcus saprophyticus]
MKRTFSISKLDTKEILLITQSLLLGSTIFGRGVLWFTSPETILKDSSFYLALNEIMPIWLWGLIIMVTGFLYTMSALFVTSMEENSKYYFFIFVG